MTTSVTKKIGNAFTVGNNRACSDRESGENKCSDGDFSTEGRVSSKESICYGYGQK